MNHFLRACIILLLFGSCNTSAPVPSIFGPSDLPSQFVQINTLEDTTLQLAGGTLLIIPANALKAEGETQVKLEIKEAVTIEDMLLAALHTESNGQPLRSGGMIYINPSRSAKVDILKPVQIKIPTDDKMDNMMLFNGKEEGDGINWVSPQPIPMKPNTVDIAVGQKIFMSSCTPCHAIDRKTIGPALYGTMQRWKHDTAAVYRYTRNNAAVVASGDSYACCIFKSFNKLAMNPFPTLTDKELEAIYHYIDREGKKKWDVVPPHLATSECDDCRNRPTATPMRENSTVFEVAGFPEIKKQPFYEASIQTFGWYNIDQLILKSANCVLSELDVHITGQLDESVSLSLVIPYYKIYLQGGLYSDGKTYGFNESGYDMLLPEGITAYVIASKGTDPQKLSFGVKKFTTSRKQSLTMDMKPATKKEVLQFIKTIQQSVPASKPKEEGETIISDTTYVLSRLDSLCSCDTSK
ncbi:c-type cytochrome [Chitinophaga sp. SYP-B3965]|uniref:c-type cytochrome n=1 Tax=Chitinophaga sp. SYP-B3965 TaxID=2663120 RepID=UPI0012998AE2|nr:cytochrome c [Chitinophaga sp. SYP-B3965]MRG48807.1 c-type cytochrome [Chitinophaga sp. SYP-B3965]